MYLLKEKITIINGPNLNLIGIREPDIYGTKSFDEYIPELRFKFEGITIEYFQTNHEGEIIDKIHEIGFSHLGIIINAGAYSHTSIAIADALRAVPLAAVEVHISDITKREDFRKHSFIKDACQNVIVGKGLDGYEEAVRWLITNHS